MSRKKLSIHDVLNEDRTQLSKSAQEEGQEPVQESTQELSLNETSQKKNSLSTSSKKSRKPRGRPPKKAPPVDSTLDTLFKTKENKSDYVRLSVTLPPDVFDRLQMISINRRRRKESYTFCHLVREAVQEWIDQAEEE
jgi:hypothetical protein